MSAEGARPNAYATFLRLALAAYTVHFKSHGYIKDSSLDLLDSNVCKQILELSIKKSDVRHNVGGEIGVWEDLQNLFRAGTASLQQRSFAPPDPSAPEYEGASGAHIAFNYSSLLKDLERINDLMSIARNVLTAGEVAQNLAIEALFDHEIFRLINLCVKVTARGYDGDAGTAEEEKWQRVVNAYKKVLIVSLQLLNNLVAQNERNKLMLWVELFDSTADYKMSRDAKNTETDASAAMQEAAKGSGMNYNRWDISARKERDYALSLVPLLRDLGLDAKDNHSSTLSKAATLSKLATISNIAAECQNRWQNLSDHEKSVWTAILAEFRRLEGDVSEILPTIRTVDENNTTIDELVTVSRANLQVQLSRLAKSLDLDQALAPQGNSQSKIEDSIDQVKAQSGTRGQSPKDTLRFVPAEKADFKMPISAADGALELQKGKDSLMKHINYPRHALEDMRIISPSSPVASTTSAGNKAGNEINSANGGLEDSDDDSDEDDYVIPGDDGRGLLTDVPLILGPTEIEVLPMIIMSGICHSETSVASGRNLSSEESKAIVNMHAVRCHLLLAQDNGRNLLRELLIFVAAWDLHEDELYFKFMVKIMDAILENGLMSFTYHTFRESKDIISPAQAVIMKLLTNIFRSRPSNTPKQRRQTEKDKQSEEAVQHTLKYDVHLVNYLLTQFRQHIIPQTCALIFLQGQIAAGHAQPEEFPLNLWDMERMYEGVYQYLEFFAILTEHETWKNMMADWEIASELIALLKELELAIPKGQFTLNDFRQKGVVTEASALKLPEISQNQQLNLAPPSQALSVERPYDINLSDANNKGPTVNNVVANDTTPFLDETQEEPSDFEWRNLKKLAVLVLSSLVWRSRKMQDQVRKYGGVEAVLACCTYDEHNPYIREHAIMCLRFLMEGHQDNQDIIRQLEARAVVPSEVLDQHGYETFMDAKGQVGLRRKESAKVTKHDDSKNTKGQAKNSKRP